MLHPDYAPLSFANTEPIAWEHGPRLIRIKYYHDEPIELSKPATTAEARADALANFATTMRFAYFGKHCEWTHARRSLAVLKQMRVALEESTNSPRLRQVPSFDVARAQKDCNR
ncbi:MAG TPA: hypothetical protein VK025_04635 [Steroidobacter sp.]|nr:hypothetical protein [Steroidobacter sp.]